MWSKVVTGWNKLVARDETKWNSLSKLDIITLALSGISFIVSPDDRTYSIATWGLIWGGNALTAFLANKPKKG